MGSILGTSTISVTTKKDDTETEYKVPNLLVVGVLTYATCKVAIGLVSDSMWIYNQFGK